MRSFRDRSPILIGLGSMAVIAVLVAAAFAVGLLHLFEDAYTVRGVFDDAAGIKGGDDVRVAGVKAGRVIRVEADRRAGNVVIEFNVNSKVDLGMETSAEVALQTLLGTKFIRLTGPVTKPYLKDAPEERRVIPISRTKTPFDIFELTKIGTRSIQQTDTEKLNQLIGQLATVTEGKQQTLRDLIEGINRFSTALNERDDQLRSLLDRTATLSGILSERDQTLVGLIDQSQGVLDLVSRRRGDIKRGIESANLAIGQLSGVLTTNQTQIDLILDTLHPTLGVIAHRQQDVDRALNWIGLGALGLAKAGTHGPWNEVYVRDIQFQFIGTLECLRENPNPAACL